MIQKIKDLLAMQEHIEVIKNNLNYANNSVTELKNEIGSLKDKITGNMREVNEKNTEFFKNFQENVDIIKNTRNEFEKELFDFKLLKAQMQKKVIDKFEEELDKELKIQVDNLKIDAEKYNELKEGITQITKQVSPLGEEISKFLSISRNIKKEDFEMTKFARQVLEMDREKLELMRKIDTLERLISKLRRQEFITR